MGLYLAVFEEDDELDGIDVGSYSDFSFFRNTVVACLEPAGAGSRFPTLILHADCDGEWTPEQSQKLDLELAEIASEFQRLPPVVLNSTWQTEVVKTFGLPLATLYDCFFDVDGESLLERMRSLAQLSINTGHPILFQ